MAVEEETEVVVVVTEEEEVEAEVMAVEDMVVDTEEEATEAVDLTTAEDVIGNTNKKTKRLPVRERAGSLLWYYSVMLALLLYIIFGLIFGYFATLNTSIVSVNFGAYALNTVPMYILILLSFGIGVLFATVFYLVKLFTLQRLINKKDKELMACEKETTDLIKAGHKLEIDNTRLKTKSGEEIDDDKSI